MRAAVIGTGWGRVHIAALQELGVDVVAVCGTDLDRTRAVADEHGVAQAMTGVDELPGLHLDLITIAAPTSAHAELVAHLGPTPLLCDKPAVGVETPIAEVNPPTGPVWVNYAFPFLATSGQADLALGDIGHVLGVEVRSEHDLGALVGADRTAWQWLSDVASHPWSWVVARFGEPADAVRGTVTTIPSHAVPSAQLSYASSTGIAVTVAASPLPGLSGLRHHVRVIGENGELEFGGHFRLGGRWQFGPARFTGSRRSQPEPATASRVLGDTRPADATASVSARGYATTDPGYGPDAWHRANVASIAAVLAQLRAATPKTTRHGDPEGELADHGRSVPATGTAAASPRPFTWDHALTMDACVQQAAAPSS